MSINKIIDEFSFVDFSSKTIQQISRVRYISAVIDMLKKKSYSNEIDVRIEILEHEKHQILFD